MKRSTLLAISMIMLGVLTTAVNAQKERFAGTFVAADQNTRGLTRLVINDDDTINVWGRCHPTDCDWGLETTVAYAASVDADPEATAKALTAIYVQRHAITVLVIKPLKDGSLGVDSYTRFTDRSRRAPFTRKEILVRENAVP